MNNKPFNIVIVGVGGQGLITLTRVLAIAAASEGLDVKTSELHGLSQRGGSVETHVRFGKKIYSPLVRQGGADLIISLEFQEVFRVCYYGSKEETVFLINNHIVPIVTEKNSTPIEQSLAELKDFSRKIVLTPATKIITEKIGNPILDGIFLLGLAVFKNLMPLKPDSLIAAIKEVVPQKYFDLNKKAFYLARQNFSKEI